MTQNNEDELRKKITELDDQLNSLTEMLSRMMVKMESIEQATTQMRDIIQQDMGNNRGYTDVE
jgi:prefoldin subunit 5